MNLVIIGGGPSALMLAARLPQALFSVSIYEQTSRLGRKFMVAGKGGFNLTHSEQIEAFASRYTPADFIIPFLSAFSNDDLRAFLLQIGIPTYVGTSGRVFPAKGIKPIDVLNAFLTLLKKNEVEIHTKHEWQGWNAVDNLIFKNETGEFIEVKANYVVFALGGASWKKTGSDGSWTTYFIERAIRINPFQASNCAVKIDWPQDFLDLAEGSAIKNIAVTVRNKTMKGELLITRFGLEGGAVYALSPQIRMMLAETGAAKMTIDFKPALSISDVLLRIASIKKSGSRTKGLNQQLKLSETTIALLKLKVSKEDFMDDVRLAQHIKSLELQTKALAPMDEAISTAGGLALSELKMDGDQPSLELKKIPNHFVMGEMLDWDAPTGGYLLQACFSMAVFLCRDVRHRVSR